MAFEVTRRRHQKIQQQRTEFSYAAAKGDLNRVSSILERPGIDVNFTDPEFPSWGYTPVPPPLFAACKAGQLEVVRVLLKHKDIQVNFTYNEPNHGKETPLSAAAENGYTKIMKLLLDHGASVYHAEEEKFVCVCALKVAVIANQYEAAVLLLENGADVRVNTGMHGDTPLMLAAQSGHTKLAELLLDKGAELHPTFFTTCTHILYSPLALACANGHTECARLLIGRGAMVNDKSYDGCTPLFDAARNGKLVCARLLLENGAHVDETNDSRKTPLMIASENCHIDVVQLLLEYKAQVNENHNETPLMLASEHCHIEVVQLLLENNADVNAVYYNKSALSLACTCPSIDRYGRHHNPKEVAEVLIKNGADVNQVTSSSYGGIAKPILFREIESGRSDIVSLLLQNGAKTDTTDGCTPLMCAVKLQTNLEIIELLLSHKVTVDKASLSMALESKNFAIAETLLQHASEDIVRDVSHILIKAAREKNQKLAEMLLRYNPDIDVQDQSAHSPRPGNTPLMEAALNGDEELVKLFLDHGAQINLQNSCGNSALMLAFQGLHGNQVHTECVQWLLEREDINVNLTNDDGDSTLMLACQIHFLKDTIKQLLDRGAQPNMQNSSGDAALLIACRASHTEGVKQLLEGSRDIDVNFKNNTNGDTALIIAIQQGNVECVELLLEHKDIDVNLQNNKEDSALMVASRMGNASVVNRLTEHGAKLEITDIRGWSALFYAVKSNNVAVVETLLAEGADIYRVAVDGKTVLELACNNENPNKKIIEMLLETRKKQGLTEKEHLKICQYVQPLKKCDIIRLGQALGLLRSKVTKMESLPDDMVDAWLIKTDDVLEKSGPPTWESLCKALREIGQGGIATAIETTKSC